MFLFHGPEKASLTHPKYQYSPLPARSPGDWIQTDEALKNHRIHGGHTCNPNSLGPRHTLLWDTYVGGHTDTAIHYYGTHMLEDTQTPPYITMGHICWRTHRHRHTLLWDTYVGGHTDTAIHYYGTHMLEDTQTPPYITMGHICWRTHRHLSVSGWRGEADGMGRWIAAELRGPVMAM